MTKSYYDIRPPVLCGDKDSGTLCQYADSMGDKVNSCGEPFPESGLCMVTKGSPLSYKKAVETIGVYFIRELGYDFRPFTVAEYSNCIYRDPSERTTDKNTRSFLWYSPHEGHPGHWPTFGACTFRLRRSMWLLKWIWIHPYERRKGRLKSADGRSFARCSEHSCPNRPYRRGWTPLCERLVTTRYWKRR